MSRTHERGLPFAVIAAVIAATAGASACERSHAPLARGERAAVVVTLDAEVSAVASPSDGGNGLAVASPPTNTVDAATPRPCSGGWVRCGAMCFDLDEDARNCGACGQVCDGTCSKRQCVREVAKGQDHPVSLAADSKNVYWVNFGGAVMKAGASGGEAVTLATVADHPMGVAVDSTHVYWTSHGGTVASVPKSGGPTVTLVTKQKNPAFLAVDANLVYWTNRGAHGAVVAVAKRGGAPLTLASDQPEPAGIATSDSSVFWVNEGAELTGEVMRRSKSGGSIVTLAAAQDAPWDLAVVGDSVYWTNFSSDAETGAVMKVGVDGGVPAAVALHQNHPTGIAADDGHVYWTNTGLFGGAAMMASSPGGELRTLAEYTAPTRIVASGSFVFWNSLEWGKIVRASVP